MKKTLFALLVSLFSAWGAAQAGSLADIGVVNRDTADRPRTLVGTPLSERAPAISPDGRLIAFDVQDAGQSVIHVAAFPSLADRLLVATGGTDPRWSNDGTLFFRDRDGHVVAVRFRQRTQFGVASRRVLPVTVSARSWDVDGSGRRFASTEVSERRGEPRLVVTLNALEGKFGSR